MGDDTDLLVLLIFHGQPQGKDMFFVPEPQKNSKACVWNIKETKEKLGPILCKLDTFFSGNNGATRLLPDSNDSSFKAESNDTNHECCFKNIGSVLGHYSTCVRGRQLARI